MAYDPAVLEGDVMRESCNTLKDDVAKSKVSDEIFEHNHNPNPNIANQPYPLSTPTLPLPLLLLLPLPLALTLLALDLCDAYSRE